MSATTPYRWAPPERERIGRLNACGCDLRGDTPREWTACPSHAEDGHQALARHGIGSRAGRGRYRVLHALGCSHAVLGTANSSQAWEIVAFLDAHATAASPPPQPGQQRLAL